MSFPSVAAFQEALLALDWRKASDPPKAAEWLTAQPEIGFEAFRQLVDIPDRLDHAILLARRMPWHKSMMLDRLLPFLMDGLQVNYTKNQRCLALLVLLNEAWIYLEESSRLSLLGLVFDEEEMLRYLAVFHFSRLNYRPSIPYLVFLLDDNSLMVRRESQKFLSRSDTPEARVALMEWEKRR